VFKGEKDSYTRFIRHLRKQNLDAFASESLTIDDCQEQLESWQERFFDPEEHVGDGLLRDLFHLARHIAQHPGEAPQFFAFEERRSHNLDALAAKVIWEELGPNAIQQLLESEYNNSDRYWSSLYPDFNYFEFQYYACQRRLMQRFPEGRIPLEEIFEEEDFPSVEIPEAVKAKIKRRDKHQCICCGSTSYLEIDHIHARYYGGTHDLANLQTLCRRCNLKKNTEKINFLSSSTSLESCPGSFPEFQMLSASDSEKKWETVLRRSINFFYRCSAVQSIQLIPISTGEKMWRIRLNDGNDPAWLQKYLSDIEWKIKYRRGSNARPQKMVIEQSLVTLTSKK
jgi:hypothetical protein